MTSIIQPWVAKLGLRMQGVLVSAIRGPDFIAREDPAKIIIRMYRGEILIPFCGDLKQSTSYMFPFNEEEFQQAGRIVSKSCDHYNLHFFMHLVHAVEIMGYYAPERNQHWNWLYLTLCKKLHLNPETKSELNIRLGADEVTFGQQQEQ